MRTAYLTHPSCQLHEMGAYHPECPARLQAIADRLAESGLLERMEGFEAPGATLAQLERAHTRAHVERVRALAPAEGYAQVDPDTAMNRFSWEAALHAAGAVVKAVELVGSGEFRRAFCNVRPPGHHAERARARGFCLFDNVAIGALHALDALGLERVAIIDFDVHHGNGTEDIVAGDDRILMVSTFQSPLYPYSGERARGPNMCNVALSPGSGADALRAAVDGHWMPALNEFRPQMLLVSAGFDAHRDDELAQLRWQEADYAWVSERIVEVADRWAEGRVVSVLEGGYSLPALARSVAAHVAALIGDSAG